MTHPTSHRYLSLGADVVAFDHQIRHGSALATSAGHPRRGQFFPHRQRVPLDRVAPRPRAHQDSDAPGCGPWTCPHPHLADTADPVPEGEVTVG